MKKLLKKVIVVVTAVMMLVGLLPAAAMATTEDAATPTPAATTVDFTSNVTLTINKTDSARPNPAQLAGATFAIYKIASLSTDNTSQLTYTVESAYTGAITQADLQTLGTLGAQALEAKASAVAVAAAATTATYTASSTTAADGVTVVPASVTIPGSNFGLYLIVETKAPDGYVAGKPFFVDIPRTNAAGTGWDYNITVNAKNAKTQVTKVIKLADGTEVPADTVKPGDVIKYVVEGTIPYFSEEELAAEGTARVDIKDTMTGGLALKVDASNPFTVEAVNPQSTSEQYDPITVTAPADGSTSFTVSIEDKNTLRTYKGQKIRVTYSAVVTSNITASVDAVNNASINLTPATEQPKVYTFAIQINKTGSDNTKLANVKFELYADDNNKPAATKLAEGTTDADGKIVFNQLDADNNNGAGTVYWLKETQTASGYALLAKPVKVELIPEVVDGKYTGKLSYKINDVYATTPSEDGKDPVVIVTADRTAVADIVNNKGFSLPSTGGMGTYIFTIGGIVIMAAAAVVLVAMKKRNRA